MHHYASLWAIEPSWIPGLRDRLAAAKPEAAVETRAPARSAARAIAVIPVLGTMIDRGPEWLRYFGFSMTSDIGAAFDEAMNDDRVKAVLFDFDSPGGMVSGTPELAAKIYAARGTKPIVAVANAQAASAAYWAATAADRLYVTPSGGVGSVGVYVVHAEESKLLEEMGVKVDVIRAGEHKAECNPWEPLTDAAREHLQSTVDEIYGDFVSAVAKHRGRSVADVRENFGKGWMLGARQSVERGMADGIATFDQVVARLHAGKIRTDGPAANDDWESPVLAIDEQAAERARLERVHGMKVSVRNRE